MKRLILIALIGYIIGIIWELYFKTSIVPFIIVLTIIYAICRRVYHTSNTRVLIRPCIVIIIFLCAIISNSITIYLDNKYDNIYKTDSEENTYTGTIISNKSVSKYKSSYTIRIDSINGKTSYKGIQLILNIPNRYEQELKYGNKIKFQGIYNAPEIQRNYKGFDYSRYLKSTGIYGTVTYSGNKIQILENKNLNIIKMITHHISINIEDNIKKIYEEKQANLLIGILLGNNKNIDEETKEDFRNSGIYHILAVSGAHMSYVILGITYMVEKIDISKRKKNILKIVGIIFFMLITNNTISVTRAGIMAIITIGADIFYRKKDIINAISISMLIILIYNPYSINNISFQLSYGGVIGILLLNNFYIKLLNKIKINQKISQIISVILSAQTIIIPVMILNYHTISLTFLFANILVTHIIGIIIILGFICAFISFVSLEISGFIGIFLNYLLKILIYIAKFFGDIPLSKIYITTPSMLSIILYYAIICLLKTNKTKLKKIITILLIISIVFNSYIHIPLELKIHFIDVGQGDSCLIITPSNKKILIDGGGTENTSGNYDIGENTLLPYLLDRGVRNLDYILISHFDADHCQGLLAVLNSLKVKNIIISKQAEKVHNYEKIMEIVLNKKINVIVVKRGNVINVDNNVEIKIIYPEGKLYFDDINSNSIVAKLTYNNFSMLFTGDIEKSAEQRIVNIAKNELKATILKVAHHGSKTSSTQEFLEAVKPEIALIGVGKNNKFGHPNDDVIERLKEKRSKNI